MVTVPARFEITLTDDDGTQLGGVITQRADLHFHGRDYFPDTDWSVSLRASVTLPTGGRVPFTFTLNVPGEVSEQLERLEDDGDELGVALTVPVPPTQIMKSPEGRVFKAWNLNTYRANEPSRRVPERAHVSAAPFSNGAVDYFERGT